MRGMFPSIQTKTSTAHGEPINTILYCFRDQKGCKSKKIPSALTCLNKMTLQWAINVSTSLLYADEGRFFFTVCEMLFSKFYSILHPILTSKENVVQSPLISGT